MKKGWVIVCVVALFVTFGIGALSQHAPQAAARKKQSVCLGSQACLRAAMSIFSKDFIQKAANLQQIPPGFCLHVPVLLYHHIQPEADAVVRGQTSLTVDANVFDQQMGYLAASGYHTISAEQLVDAILSHTQLAPKTVVVTMDDGYLDNFTYAFPILQKYHLVGNLMVPTGLLGANAGTNVYYTWDQLKQMVASGVMYAYNHTWSHYAMGTGPAAKDTYETTTAQQQLSQNLGKTSPVFVYPYGSGQTLGWVWSLLKSNGFLAAFSTLPGTYQCEGNIMELPRIHIGNAPLASYGI